MTGDSAKAGTSRLTKKPENWEFITDKTIERLLKAAPVNRIIWDEGSGSHQGKKVYAERGFGARITEAGTVSFVLNYHDQDGKERRFTIGRHPEYTPITARKEAKDLQVEITKGADPLEERQILKEEPTFAELAADWLVHAKNVKHKRESSLRDDRRMLGLQQDKDEEIEDKDPAMRKRRILPLFGLRRLSKITQREIAVFHTALRDTPVRPNRKTTPYRANRALVLIKTIFNFGMTDPKYGDWIELNPAQGIKLFPEEKREDFLDKGEITKFLRALNSYENQKDERKNAEQRKAVRRNAANCLRLMLLSGCRPNEALTAKWSDFDLNRGIWTKLSHSTKQRKTEHVQLGDAAVDLLQSMKPKNATGPLFPGRNGGMRESLKRPWLQVCKAAGLVDSTGKPTLPIYSMRHTYASVLVSNGESLFAVGKQLGHVQPSTTNRYSHFAPEAGKATANKFAQIIEFKKRA